MDRFVKVRWFLDFVISVGFYRVLCLLIINLEWRKFEVLLWRIFKFFEILCCVEVFRIFVGLIKGNKKIF